MAVQAVSKAQFHFSSQICCSTSHPCSVQKRIKQKQGVSAQRDDDKKIGCHRYAVMQHYAKRNKDKWPKATKEVLKNVYVEMME
ncbi:Enoyl-[acyl-carrier-protein] reductase [Trichinella pseudospiralis]